MTDNDGLFAPSPELQSEIDEALQERLEARRDKGWTSKKGVLLSKKREQRTFPVATSAMSYSAVRTHPSVMSGIFFGKP